MNLNFKENLLKSTGASACTEVEVIQSLWSGYGKISRCELTNASVKTVVVKHISLSQSGAHPRGWNTSNSHHRKVKSYEVETHWYREYSSRCNANSRIPNYLGSYKEEGEQWIILEDLDAHYPVRKHRLEFAEVKACLTWLAHFHATFLHQKPEGLWEVGTYWHLDTRPDEFEKIEHEKLKSAAHYINDGLNQCKYQTLVHGDAKLANFCFSESGTDIAAVDFQYVGGGCGIKDVAYFLGSCLSSSECQTYEKELLNFYFSQFRAALESSGITVEFSALEREWREMYPLACTDFTRFLLGWMPSHQKINEYSLNLMRAVLEKY